MGQSSKIKGDKMQQLQSMRDVSRGSDQTIQELARSRCDVDTTPGARAGAPSQMVDMAKRFGLSAQDIAAPRWRALEVIDTCRHCDVASQCFNYLIGDRRGDFAEADCPNAERYSEAALEASHTR